MANVDRIAEPWGTRTPFGPGEEWPTRVDLHLAEGLSEADVDSWAQSASILHSNGDALDIAVKDDRIVGVRGRAVDRVNHGRLGPKDLFAWQANHSPDRLTRPLIRREGKLVETDWDTAMDAVAGRTKDLLQERGPSSIGFYTTGQLFLEEYYLLGLIGHGGIGTNHVDGNTRLCTATAAAALKQSFACDGQPGSYTDIDYADVIALYGHNMAETQTVLWSRILDRRAGPEPPKIICVDPRATPVAREATVHLAPKPGTNVMLMNALLHEIIPTTGWIMTMSTGTPSVSTSWPGRSRIIHRSGPRQSVTFPPTTSGRRRASWATANGCSPRCCRVSINPTKPRPRPCR